MENNSTLGKVVLHLWLSSLGSYIVFSFISHLIYETAILGGEYFFLMVGPYIYMYFFKKKYNKHFSLAFSRRVAKFFTASFLIFYFSIGAFSMYSPDQESTEALANNLLPLLISMLALAFGLYSFGRIGLTLMLSDEVGEFEVSYIKYVAIFVAIAAIALLIYMVTTTITNSY